MRKRGARPLKELYDLTDRITQPEMTPVLEGSCRIQGPVDEPDQEHPRKNMGFPAEKRYGFVNENPRPRTESGTCNMCSAPCSSCMHLHRTASFMESNVDCVFPGNTFGRTEDYSCSFIGADGLPFYKSRTCDDNQHAASEASNLLSVSSSHDSYSENAESKATCRASVTFEASDGVDMPSKVSKSAEVGKDLPSKTNASSHSLFSSQSHTTSHIGCKTLLSQVEEQRGSECHGDNISCITAVRDANVAVRDRILDGDKKEAACSGASTGSLLGKGIEDEVQVKAAHGFDDHKTEENQTNSRSPNIHNPESSIQKRTGHDPSKAGTFDKPGLAEVPLFKQISSPKVQSPCFSSQKEYLFHHNVDSEDLEGNSCSHVRSEPFDCTMENVKSSSRDPLAGSVNKHKLTALPIYEDNKTSSTRSYDSSEALKHTDPCLETETPLDTGISSDEVTKCSIINEQLENSNAFADTSNMQVPHIQAKTNMEGEHSRSDGGLYDVKVCDICGDAGREELLAMCSGCSDGAEHTYCMRKKLDKLPEGDWLCEECKIKEDTEFLKADKSDSVTGTSKPIVLNGKSRNLIGTLNRTLVPKLNTKMIEDEARGVVKGLGSPEVSSTRHGGNLVDFSATSKRASEASGESLGTATTRKKIAFPHLSSSKLDMGKVKPVPVSTGSAFGAQSANNPTTFSRLGSNSFKIQSQLQSPRVPVSRSKSFNSSNFKPSPRVKPLTESVIGKLKVGRQSTSIDSRKEGLMRTLTKSEPFKSGSSDLSNIESVGKLQSLIPSQGKDPSGLKQLKESNVLAKKNYSIPDRESPLADISIPLPKADLKVARHDGKLQTTSEYKSPSIRKVTHYGNDTVKKQSSSKYFGSQTNNGVCNSVDKKPSRVSKDGIRANSDANDGSYNKVDAVLQHGATQAVESVLRGDKTKESSHFISSNLVVSGGNQILYCQRCNETGLSTQICPIDELSTSSLKPTVERNMKEGIIRSKKWNDAGEPTDTTIGIQKTNRLPDQSMESLSPSADLICGTTNKNILSNSSSCPEDFPTMEGMTHDQDIMRSSDAGGSKTTDIDTSQKGMHPVGASYVPTDRESNCILNISDESNIKSSMQIFPDQTSILTNSLRASATPELEFIWQGGFEVMRTGRLPELFDGIQAYLSNCASPKVPKVVTGFPSKLQLEEVPCVNSWLSQFQESGPTEDNIALFIFAKDIESYEKNYSKLLENMLANDLALRGDINGVELLIFPSNTLPASCQYWNKLFFLWGVFRGRTTNCLESVPGYRKKPCRSMLCTDSLVQDLPSPLINDVSDSQKIDLMENQDVESSWRDRSSKAKATITTTSADCWPISSCSVNDQTCNTEVSPLVGNSLYRPVADCKLPLEHTSIPVRCSLIHADECTTLLDSCPELRINSSAKMLHREGDFDASYLENAGIAAGEVAETPSHVHAENVHTRFSVLPSNGDSLCSPGADGYQSEEKIRESFDPSWESRPSRKSMEIVNVEYERKHKKMKPCSEGRASRTSSKVHPLVDNFLNEQETMTVGNSRGDEKCLFQVDFGPVRYTKPDNVIHISSDKEELVHYGAPFLELALGCARKSDKQKELSLPGPTVDTDLSLSLSLGFPPGRVKPILKSDQLMLDSSHVDTSLLLSSRFHGT